MRNQRVLLSIIALLVGLVSLTAGCGGNGSEATPTPKAKATATAGSIVPTATVTAGPIPPTATVTAGPIPTTATVATPSTELPTAASGSPTSLAIVNPVSGQKVAMAISVVVQAPDLGSGHLSVWVRPIPADPGQQYWAQEPPVETTLGTWKSNPVYVGQETDPSGLPFRICAVVTQETYSHGQQANELPEGPNSCVDVTRQ